MTERQQYLRARLIVTEYEYKHPNLEELEKDPPLYVSLKGTEMKYDPHSDNYYRDAGAWSVDYRIADGKIFSVCNGMDWLHDVELVVISHEEWLKGNDGYV